MLVTFFVMLVIFSMYLIGHQHPESVTNILNLSPTLLISNIHHQQQCYQKLNYEALDSIKKMFVIPNVKHFGETCVLELIEGPKGFIIETANIFLVKIEFFIHVCY